jgi:hypothetical protein
MGHPLHSLGRRRRGRAALSGTLRLGDEHAYHLLADGPVTAPVSNWSADAALDANAAQITRPAALAKNRPRTTLPRTFPARPSSIAKRATKPHRGSSSYMAFRHRHTSIAI